MILCYFLPVGRQVQLFCILLWTWMKRHKPCKLMGGQTWLLMVSLTVKCPFLRVPLRCQEKNFRDSRSCLLRQISTLASKSYATSDVILGSMRHQIMRASLDFQIILSSSDFLAYLAWQPLLNLNPQNCSSFLSFVVKYIKTRMMQCSLKLELFFIARGNSGFNWVQQIRDICWAFEPNARYGISVNLDPEIMQ